MAACEKNNLWYSTAFTFGRQRYGSKSTPQNGRIRLTSSTAFVCSMLLSPAPCSSLRYSHDLRTETVSKSIATRFLAPSMKELQNHSLLQPLGNCSESKSSNTILISYLLEIFLHRKRGEKTKATAASSVLFICPAVRLTTRSTLLLPGVWLLQAV